MKNITNLLIVIFLISASCSNDNDRFDKVDKNFPEIDFDEIAIESLPDLPNTGRLKGKLWNHSINWESSIDTSSDIRQGISYIAVENGSSSSSSSQLPIFDIENKKERLSIHIMYRGLYDPPEQLSDNLINCSQDERVKIWQLVSHLRSGSANNFSFVIKNKTEISSNSGSINPDNYVKLSSYRLYKVLSPTDQENLPALILNFDVKYLDDKGNNIFTGQLTSTYVGTPKTCL